MRALFRALMVPVSFVLFLALFAAVAVATIALGPLVLDGLKPDALPSLLPSGGAKPSPYVIAAGIAAVDTLLIGMIAMLVSEKVSTVGRFVRSLLKTAIWFAVLSAGPLAVWLHGQDGAGWTRYAPAILLAAGLVLAAVATGLLLGKPFLWWVSERPVERRRKLPPPASVAVVPLVEASVPAPAAPAETAAPPVPGPPPVPAASTTMADDARP